MQYIGIVGLGYVGLPLAVEFGKVRNVIGFDLNETRIGELRNGYDRTGEVSGESLAEANIDFTVHPEELRKCDFVIVCVPTPVDQARQPDLGPIRKASELVGRNLKRGAVVVYESTVYPGVTEEICAPILERESAMVRGKDFFVAYSPERINPGDREHTLRNVVKVVSGESEQICNLVAELYSLVVPAGVYKASSIRVAEAAKVIENTQRDLNIALMNELSMLFNLMGIDTNEVLEACRTKWNFMGFRPGLVGGHCIGVDPYYLTFKARSLGFHPQLITAGRLINDGMGKYVARSVVKKLVQSGVSLHSVSVNILGITFKENIRDTRNSKVIDVIEELNDYGITVRVTDPHADPESVMRDYGIQLWKFSELPPAHAVILAVPHREYMRLRWTEIGSLLHDGAGVVADLKGVLSLNDCPEQISVWRL
ncbi:nucleotide sugar dehydrogenase [Alicyclobacillus herbarius]|uniref:nucleotide sugar dehydrogenase n=1 Tax=Alicyclobacillus herbarius TaxID=122960 RepID=UPI00042263F0|nr:nucleotide sugar dehydrogenase [Alicyclobacillus herbarius]